MRIIRSSNENHSHSRRRGGGEEKPGGGGCYCISTDINSKILGLAKTPPLFYFKDTYTSN